jgi:hypothetical protein
MSGHIWAIDWEKHFPIVLKEQNVTIEKSNLEECSLFAKTHFSTIYSNLDDNSRFLWNDNSHSRDRYYNSIADFFVYKSENRPIGIFVLNPLDWGTYYIRNTSILPGYQDKKLFQHFVLNMFRILELHGVDRVHGEVCPSNLRVMNAMLKLGFKASGITLSERWGALVCFTRFLNKNNNQVFERQFCHHLTLKE